MLAQLLNNWNNNDTGSNHDEEEHLSNEQLKTEKSKENSSLDAEVLKGIQAQITSLAQRDELKKVGAVRPYPLEWDCLNHQRYIRTMVRARQTSTSTIFGLRPVTL